MVLQLPELTIFFMTAKACVCCRCLTRMIVNWDALKVFFCKEKEDIKVKSKSKGSKMTELDCNSYAEKKVETVFNCVRSPTNQLYALFLVYTHELFENVLVAFQAEEPKIRTLHRSLVKLIRNMVRFVKPSALKGKPVHEVQYKLHYNFHTSKDILIGDAARDFINNRQNNHLREECIEEFFQSAIAYFQSLCDSLLLKLLLCLKQEDDHLLKDVEVVDTNLQTSSSTQSLTSLLVRFPCLLPPGVSKQTVLEQFRVYQQEDITVCMADRIDNTWSAIGNLKDETGEQTMKELSKVMCGIRDYLLVTTLWRVCLY